MFEENKKLIYLGSDHAGFEMKEKLKEHLGEKYDLTDLGCFSEKSCDYPEIAREVGEKVLEHEGSVGIILCGSGIGMTMAVNKLKGIRGALAVNEKMAEMSRRHNDANVLSMAARETSWEDVTKIIDTFLNTDFEGGEERHVRRVKKLNSM